MVVFVVALASVAQIQRDFHVRPDFLVLTAALEVETLNARHVGLDLVRCPARAGDTVLVVVWPAGRCRVRDRLHLRDL